MRKSDTAREDASCSLESLQKSGVDFFVDGESVPLSEVMRRTLREEHTYMADYVLDRKGKVLQVHFDRVDSY